MKMDPEQIKEAANSLLFQPIAQIAIPGLALLREPQNNKGESVVEVVAVSLTWH